MEPSEEKRSSVGRLDLSFTFVSSELAIDIVRFTLTASAAGAVPDVEQPAEATR